MSQIATAVPPATGIFFSLRSAMLKNPTHSPSCEKNGSLTGPVTSGRACS